MADFDAQIFKKELQRALDAINSAPPNVQGRNTVTAVRTSLAGVFEDIATNPVKFEGSTGSPVGGG